MKKKILAIMLAAVMVCSVCAFTACDMFNTPNDSQAYVSLDINPAIELIVDSDNNVVSVRGENEDGQVLLYQEEGIVGVSVDVAIQKITDLAIEYGYLSEDNKVVDTLVTSDSDKFATEILNKVNATVTATASDLGLSVTTDGEGAYSLLRQMEEVKAQFPNNKAIQNMSVQKFKLALSVSETGDISIEAAVEMDDAELIEALKTATAKIEEFATEAYTKAKETALAAYDQVTEVASYGAYTLFYTKNILKHPTTCYYGGVYQMYATAAKGIGAVCKLAELATSVKNYPLNDEQVAAVVEALGLESSDPIKNSNGEVTVESIEAYADVLFKNSPAGQELEQMKSDLTTALGEAESVIKQKVNEISEEYKPQIEAAMEVANAAMEAVKTIASAFPLFNQIVTDFTDIMGDIETIINGDAIMLDVLKEKVVRLETKANEYLEKIKGDLSEEEWATVENDRLAIIEKMSAAKTELENALTKAEQSAKDYLASLKAERKTDNA